MSILARIRAKGGDVVRDEWRLALRRGRLDDAAVAWLRANWRRVQLEAWPEFCVWEERVAIRRFCGGQDREAAERDAYAEVTAC